MARYGPETLEDLVSRLEFLAGRDASLNEDELEYLNAKIDRRLDLIYRAMLRVATVQHLPGVVSTMYHVMIQILQYMTEEPVVKPNRDPRRIIRSRLSNYGRVGLKSREMMEEWAEDVSSCPDSRAIG